MAVVLHFQSTGTVPGGARPVPMRGGALTVGRGAENDLVLPDPSKVVSNRHCAIEDHDGRVVVVDMSTNGTFLNYGRSPLGPGPTPLNDGDILTLGPYELLVEIVEAADTAPPPVADPFTANAEGHDELAAVEDEFLDDLLGDGPPRGPRGVAQDAADEEDGVLPPFDEDDLLAPVADPFAGQGASDPSHGSVAEDHVRLARATIPEDWDELIAPEEPPARDAAPLKASQVAAPAVGDGRDPARAFLDAAGAGGLDIADADLAETMTRLGHVLRTLVFGIREALMTRASIKSEFRIRQTVIGAGGNNPLKFSVTPEQAVEALVRPKGTGFLGPVDAAREAIDDIKAHEVATMAGLEAALKNILRQLGPDAVAGQIETSGGLGSVFKGRKARYWEVYEKMYAKLADEAENDFHDLFAREFSRAYSEQLQRLKSGRRG